LQQKNGFENIRSSSLNRKTAENQSDMTTANIKGRRLEHDTTMCGAYKVWFPMEVAYSRELKVKAESDRLKIENFVSMTFKLMDGDMENPHRELMPAINDSISVYSVQDRIGQLKYPKMLHSLRLLDLVR